MQLIDGKYFIGMLSGNSVRYRTPIVRKWAGILRFDNLEPFPESAKDEQTKLRDAINTLFDSGFFKSERTPYEIYRECYTTVKESIRPKDIMRILTDITGRSGYPKLERFECKEMGYVYS